MNLEIHPQDHVTSKVPLTQLGVQRVGDWAGPQQQEATKKAV